MKKGLLTIVIIVLTACGFMGFTSYIQWQLTETDRVIEVVTTEDPEDDGGFGFPIKLQGTTLYAESLAAYDGDMIEYTSDRYLVNAAALEVYNYGLRDISLAEVHMRFGEEEMYFFGTNIPAGGRVLLVEQQGKSWTVQECTDYRATVEYADTKYLTEKDIRMEDYDMGTVAVTNITPRQLKDICLYYKTYMADGDIYIGGITYTIQIAYIDPGETIYISPRKYASGYSKFVRAEEWG